MCERRGVHGKDTFGASYWQDAAAQRWIEQQAVLDRALAPFGAALLETAAAQLGESVVDIGCGAGTTTIELARRVGAEGRVVGVDVSGPLLEHAAGQAPPELGITWENADAATWAPPTPVDLMFSRFGVMFFKDPLMAFRNLAHGLRRGGRFCATCWCTLEENPWIEQCMRALEGLVADPWPNPTGPGPLSLGRGEELRMLLVASGFGRIKLQRVQAPVLFSHGDLEHAIDFAMHAGPASRCLIDATPEVRSEARERYGALLDAHRSEAGIALDGACWLVSANV